MPFGLLPHDYAPRSLGTARAFFPAMPKLRAYQEDCVRAHWTYFSVNQTGNPLFVMPTGSGKSHVIGEVAKVAIEAHPSTKIAMVTHVKELIVQNREKLEAHLDGLGVEVGIYSAGIGQRDTEQQVICAGIQSIYRRAHELPIPDLVMIDEAHLIPKSGMGMYLSYLQAVERLNPRVRVIGYTATPYRLDGGYLHEGTGRIFTDIAYEVQMDILVPEFLAPLVAKKPRGGEIDTSGVKTSQGDFKKGELTEAAIRSDVEAAVDEIVQYGTEQERRSWLVFCCGVDHGVRVTNELFERGVDVQPIFGSTPKERREEVLRDFKEGRIRCVVNVGVLTTGFDSVIDLLAILRPTKSAGLYVQIMGRGTRIAPWKKDCLVLDFGGNIERHGPINRVSPKAKGSPKGQLVKVCPGCMEFVRIADMVCPDCGYVWEPPEKSEIEARHDREASSLDPLALGVTPSEWVPVDDVYYRPNEKARVSLRVDYMCGMRVFSEWVCLEHDGYALRKAQRWWTKRSRRPDLPIPSTVAEAIERTDELTEPVEVEVRVEGKYERVAGYVWGTWSQATDETAEGANARDDA